MMMHAKLLREMYSPDFHIIFVGPCVAKKTESDEFNADIETVLTFNDLRQWLEDEGISPDILKYREQDQFFPKQA